MKTIAKAIALLSFAASSATQAQQVIQWPAPAAAATGQLAYFPMGTELRLTTRTELTTKDNHAGDRFYLEVAEPLIYRGQTVVPVGSVAVGEVARAERNGYFGKKGQVEVRLLYVQTPSGRVRLSGHVARSGKDQGLIAIGGFLLVSWPMMFIHGTSGTLPHDTSITAYLADDMPFAVQAGAVQQAAVSVVPDGIALANRPLPAKFDPTALVLNRP